MSCCYITAFYDINRSGWSRFSRTFDDYLEYFAPYIDLFKNDNGEDHMIVFIDDRYIDRLYERVGNENMKIMLVPINEAFLKFNIHCWQFLEKEREIMGSKFFKSVIGDRKDYPEAKYPEYTLINHAKIDFVIYAIYSGLTSAETLVWCDFGFFSRKENIPRKLLDISNFDLSKVNYTLINPIEDIDRDIFYTLRYAKEKVGGFFFIGNRNKLIEYQKAYHESLEFYRKKGICDDDQAMVLYIHFNYPELIKFHVKEYGWHRVFCVNQKKEAETKEKRVISFCLWGNESRYIVGLKENLKLVEKYYPDFTVYVYVGQEYEFLKHEKCKVIVKNGDVVNESKKCMLWRLEPIMDETVDVFISRDVDTRIQLREVMAVREWLNDESKVLHIMRDHPQHYNKILGGMYGVRTKKFRGFNWLEMIETYYRVHGSLENDQHFLEKFLYNMTSKEEKMIHDEIKRYEGEYCKKFKIRYNQNRFVGCYVYEDERNDEETEIVLRNYLLRYLPDRMNHSELTIDRQLELLSKSISTIYIIHYTKLYERKELMVKQLRELCLDRFFDIVWVDNFDREKIAGIKENYSDVINRNMTVGEIANMKAHEYVLSVMRGNCLVIEDDCVFKENFIENLYRVISLLDKTNWDMCCLGGPIVLNEYPARALDKSTKNVFDVSEIEVYRPETPAPCTLSAMLYNERGKNKIKDSIHIKSYKSPSDHAVWLANMEKNVEMRWVQPFITYEGSKTDLFTTSFQERGF